MAKITITIEDLPNGGVKTVANPTFETLMKKMTSGNQLSAADGYAASMLLHLHRKSKEQGGLLKVKTPRIVRPS